MHTAIFVAALPLFLAACRASDGPDPGQVPERELLSPSAVEVLQLTFEASDAGYALLAARRAQGAPTLAVVQDRDVVVTARDAAGNAVQTVSVVNPRSVRTAGTDDPATAVLDRATFSVHMPNPDAIRSVDVRVLRGPNEGREQSFAIERVQPK